MATKRMFDKAIIETDGFLNISMSAKALYFLLGMEADDEGFVSPNRVIRLYGGEMGDIKNLIDVGLIIPFHSGVVVITDWKQNNWLDNRRIKPTQYQKEKKMLGLTENNKYVLSNGLASAEPVERSRVERSRVEITPSQQAQSFFSGDIEEIFNLFLGKGIMSEVVLKNEFQKFIAYWTEPNKTGTKQRWEQQKTFEVKRRLVTWLNNVKNYQGKSNQPNYVL